MTPETFVRGPDPVQVTGAAASRAFVGLQDSARAVAVGPDWSDRAESGKIAG